jgi:peptidoglycan/xylan/chitin deacetylase (PgdA/CDA1 family)
MIEIRRLIRRLFGEPTSPVILMFHRVAEPASDPWALAVSPSHFEAQMRLVKDKRIPFSLSEFVTRLQDGSLPPQAVAVTFDDGYVDNLRFAKPILERVGVPATVFLTTGYIGKRNEFWWDELARLVLAGTTAAEGTIVIAGQSIAVQFTAADALPAGRDRWRGWEAPRTARQRIFIEIWQALRGLDHAARESGLNTVRQLLARESGAESDFPMTADEVRQLVHGVGIDIGAHTESHRPLTAIDPGERRDEIVRSRSACEALAGAPIEGFAYPYGDFNAVTKTLVQQAGLRWACSTERAAVNRERFDLFSLPRIQALDWSAAQLAKVLETTRCAA